METGPAPKPPVAMSVYIRAAIFGALASFIALLPVSVVKTIMFFASLCIPLTAGILNVVLTPTTCGLFLNTWDTTPAISILYILLTLIGGALAGLWGARIAVNRPHAIPLSRTGPQRPRVFWWSFGAGLLFDALFVFVFMYMGQ
jgi:hypothetical protein